MELIWGQEANQLRWGRDQFGDSISGVNLDNLFFDFQYVQKRLFVAGKHTAQADPPQEGHSAKQFVDSLSNPSYTGYSSFVRSVIIYLLNLHSCSSQISVLYLERWATSSSNSLIQQILDLMDVLIKIPLSFSLSE